MALVAVAAATQASAASGWPSQYEGVMLQGFYWDSFTDTKWTNLESQADELSQNFDLIWVPNSGRCGSGNNMGYMPQYWFSNHNSSFGTQSELTSMIKVFKEKGTGIIADVVINHRNGVTNWHDFPKETWDGKTWSIGLDGICCNDEMAYAQGQPKPTGGYDTGDNFDGCRDLDHTNANVQDNCKNYCRFLLEELGYAGFRYDMVKGYGGEYTKIYNEYSNPTYSVGEYWDASYDAVKGWIEATGRTSAAFDFPFKYAVNEAFSSGDLSKLVWKANGTTDQPAGMIHFGYPRYSVTFIDNHDTYRDGSKFTGNVLAANAFMLCSPGTPCVFLPHWKENKAAIKAMIRAREEAGVHNESAVRVLRTGRDIYMAEITGKKGTLAVKIGPLMVSPDGYSDSEIRAVGTDYCIWVKTDGGGYVTDYPSDMYLIGNLTSGTWDTSASIKADEAAEGIYKWNSVEFLNSGDSYAYFTFVTAKGADWIEVNRSDRYGAVSKDCQISAGSPAEVVKCAAGAAAASAFSWKVSPGKYSVTIDLTAKKVTLGGATTGVGRIDSDDADPVWYDLLGRRVDNPSGGIFIRVCGGKSEKCILL